MCAHGAGKLTGIFSNTEATAISFGGRARRRCRLLKIRPRELGGSAGTFFFERNGLVLVASPQQLAVFSFLYFKKIKFQKYMSVFKYFKNIPWSPSHRATGPMCNFFFQICNEVPGEKKQPLSPVGGATAPPLFFSDFYFCRDLF